MTGTKRCDGCWEAETRLPDLIKTRKGRMIVAQAMREVDACPVCGAVKDESCDAELHS